MVTVPARSAGAKARVWTRRSMSWMPVAPLMGTAWARVILKPFHSPGLCEAVIMIDASAFSEPQAK